LYRIWSRSDLDIFDFLTSKSNEFIKNYRMYLSGEAIESQSQYKICIAPFTVLNSGDEKNKMTYNNKK